MNQVQSQTPVPFRLTPVAEAVKILIYGMKVEWRGWGQYLAQSDRFNEIGYKK